MCGPHSYASGCAGGAEQRRPQRGAGRSVGSAAARPNKKKRGPREALEKVMVFGRHGASPGRFDTPRGLVLVRNRFLFVSDFANKRLQVRAGQGVWRAGRGARGVL